MNFQKLSLMSKPIIHEFDPVIYPYKLWVLVHKSPCSITERFKEYSGNIIESIKRDTNMLEAFTMAVQGKEESKYGVIIYFRSKKSMSYAIVAHESSHAAKFLFDHIGADVKEHEPFEYVVGWIAECCERVLKNKE